jgi:hypothetical protein
MKLNWPDGTQVAGESARRPYKTSNANRVRMEFLPVAEPYRDIQYGIGHREFLVDLAGEVLVHQRTRREGERTPAEAEIDHVRRRRRDRLAAVLDDLQGRADGEDAVGRCTESGRAHNGIGLGIAGAAVLCVR